jgi:hypothetical protein
MQMSNPIALADCYAIALARRLHTKAVFNREQELEKAIRKTHNSPTPYSS